MHAQTAKIQKFVQALSPAPFSCYAPYENLLRSIQSKFCLPVGRGVLSVAGTVQGIKLRIATSHLESPCGHNQMFSKERVAQCKEVCPCIGMYRFI